MRRLGRRPSSALVISLIALFVSLGGVSYGLATGSIGSREIRNNSVQSRDLRNNSIRTQDLRNNEVRGRDIRNSTIQGRDVALNTLTGDDVNEARLDASKLGTVPNAAALGGLGAAAFVHGSGSVNSGGIQVARGTSNVPLAEVTGAARVETDCAAAGETLRVRNLGGAARFARQVVEGSSADAVGDTLGAAGTNQIGGAADKMVVWQLQPTAGGPVTTVTASSSGNPGGCAFMAQAVSSGP